MKTKPINGKYMTREDSKNFSQSFSEMYSEYTDKTYTELNVRNISIIVTEDCNFACTYCYQHNKTKSYLTKSMAKDIVDFLLDKNKLNDYINPIEHPCIIIDFIGGEPLLNIEVMDYFVEYFKKRAFELEHIWFYNYVISMSTNGSLYLTNEFQNFLKKNKSKVYVGLTIDGTKELHDSCRKYHNGKGTYNDVIKNVKEWIKQFPNPSTKVTLSPENLDYLVDSILHLWDLGIFSVPCNPVYENVWCKEHATKFYYNLKKLADKIIIKELYKEKYTTLFSENLGTPMSKEDNQNYCGGDGSMLSIGYDGRVYPCLRYMKYSLNNKDELCIGNIYDGIDLQENNDKLHELTLLTRKSQSTDKCFNCPIAQGCSWCSAFNYDTYGTANKRTTFHCDMHKAQVMANVYYWNKLYDKLNMLDKKEMFIPKEWALEIISKEEYDLLVNLSKN